MGAPDLLQYLRGAGLVLTLNPAGGLHVAPRSAINDDHRAAIRAERDALVLALQAEEAELQSVAAIQLPEPLDRPAVSAEMGGTTCPTHASQSPAATRRSGNPLMTPEQGDDCHAGGWDNAEIDAFTARQARFIRIGQSDDDAEDLAERLTLRDRQADDRASCAECQHYRPGRCANHRAAGLHSFEVGRDLAALLQRCPAFQETR